MNLNLVLNLSLDQAQAQVQVQDRSLHERPDGVLKSTNRMSRSYPVWRWGFSERDKDRSISKTTRSAAGGPHGGDAAMTSSMKKAMDAFKTVYSEEELWRSPEPLRCSPC